MWVKGVTRERQAPNPSFVIDLDDGIVTSSLGEFAITELTPSRISFKAKHGDTAWYGGVDRFSGDAMLPFSVAMKSSPTTSSPARERIHSSSAVAQLDIRALARKASDSEGSTAQRENINEATLAYYTIAPS